MFKLYVCLLFMSFNVLCYSDDSVVEDTELLLTFLVHRHGDRTPVEALLAYSNNQEALIAASAKYGYGQLTDIGINCGYELGQFIRRRYGGLLSPQYNISEIHIRSTDSTRAKMTVLSAMSAVYPVDQDNWSPYINWTPVPYTTVPAKYDYNLAMVNCPVLVTAYQTLLMSPSSSMTIYNDVLDQWSDALGFNLTAMPTLAYLIHDLYTSQKSLGVPLAPEIEEMYSEIEKVSDAAINGLLGGDEIVTLGAGVLLNEFFTVADQVIAGDDVPRVQIYSAHDVNVFFFEGVTQVTPRQGVPKYGSVYALELRKVVKTGEYIVVPVYLKSPSEETVSYLQVEGCGEQCDYETFRSITSSFTLEEDEWRTQCGFSADMVIDTSSIN